MDLGQRVTLQLDGPVAHVLSGGVLVRTLACPVPPEARPRLRSARPGAAQPPCLPEPLVVTRQVPVRWPVMAGGQKIQAGLPHARKTVAISVAPDTSGCFSLSGSIDARARSAVGAWRDEAARGPWDRRATDADPRRPAATDGR
jgi:hypothetical protein